ncbi:DUF58 domain-containing protein [Haloarculaceae archaeon H-GB2-1]|nr:DUF58 domain-containing protein [Haloarculaceae archaeon H-GB11]MEA5406955.1 DUF58 domain-containing protein [Haloarculaceae archaeon H-GB2-1]
MTLAYRPRWAQAITGTLALGVVGVLTATPALLLAALIPLGFVAYSAVTTAPVEPSDLAFTRDLERTSLVPGETTRVELTVENPTDRPVTSLHLVDGVPESAVVTAGTPRLGTALASGETCTVEYTVSGQRGLHAFSPPRVRTRNLSGVFAATEEVSVAGDAAVEFSVSLEHVSIPAETMPFVGPLATDVGGPGVEFHSTREYRASDPRNRIHWRSYAKSGDLSTVNYREHRAARIVVVVDARSETRVTAHPGTPSGSALGAYAGLLALQSLHDDGHAVGLAVFGLADDAGTGRAPAWVSSDASNVAVRADRLCTAAATPVEAGSNLDPSPAASAETQLDRLRKQLPADAQVLFVSAAVDDFPVTVANALRTHGHVVTVVSPDALSPLGDESAGQWRGTRRSRRPPSACSASTVANDSASCGRWASPSSTGTATRRCRSRSRPHSTHW